MIEKSSTLVLPEMALQKAGSVGVGIYVMERNRETWISFHATTRWRTRLNIL